jgi:type IV pilus assembly protein PilA
MKKLNRKGFTLIELLAVITIMGILLLVAIPAVSRTIENSRRDTFADVAKTYINSVRNSVLADELTCGGKSIAAVGDGKYFFKINSAEETSDSNEIMEQGGKSSWSNAEVEGYVFWKVDTTNRGTTTTGGEGEGEEPTTTTDEDAEQVVKTTYSILLVDEGKHGIANALQENQITRSKVKTKTAVYAGGTGADAVVYPDDESAPEAVKGATECTLK